MKNIFILLLLFIFFFKNSFGQTSNFCLGNITVTLLDGGVAQMARKGPTGSVVSRVIGNFELFGKGNPTEVLQVRFKGVSYRYDLIRDDYGNPSVLIDNQGRRYNSCSTNTGRQGLDNSALRDKYITLPNAKGGDDYDLEKVKNFYLVKRKSNKKPLFYVIPDDIYFLKKAEKRLHFESTKDLVESLNSTQIVGWRLPTFEELQIIYNLKSKFNKTPSSDMYWSSTESDKNPTTCVKSIDFGDGSILEGLKGSSGKFSAYYSSYGFSFAVKDFTSKNEDVTFKMPKDDDIYIPKDYYTKIFNVGSRFNDEENVRLNGPEFDGYIENFFAKNQIKNSELPWGDAPKANYSIYVRFTISSDGVISNIVPKIMNVTYSRRERGEFIKNTFLTRRPELEKNFSDGYYFSPNEIDEPIFKVMKDEATRLLLLSKLRPAFLYYQKVNKKVPINYESITDFVISFSNK